MSDELEAELTRRADASHCGDALKSVLLAAGQHPHPLRDLTFSIAKLELQRGDVLVVKAPGITSGAHAAWQPIVPAGVRIVYIPPEVELSVISNADIPEGEHALTNDQIRNLYKAKGL